MGLCPEPCIPVQPPGQGLICIQAAFLVTEAGLACHPDESGKSSRQGVTMNREVLQKAGMGRECMGELPSSFNAMHLPVHHLHLENNN